MRKKFIQLSNRSFLWAVGISLFSFFLYHFVTPDFTLSPVFQKEPGKPMLVELFSVFGVMFLFGGIFIRMIANIFYSKK